MRKDDFGFAKRGLTVEVKGDNVEQAMKVLKKRMANEGVFRDMRKVEAYEPPSARRKREQAEARKRHLKKQAKARKYD